MEEDPGENAVEKNDRWAVSEQAARQALAAWHQKSRRINVPWEGLARFLEGYICSKLILGKQLAEVQTKLETAGPLNEAPVRWTCYFLKWSMEWWKG